MSKSWGGRAATEAKAWCQVNYGWTCWLCGHLIEDPDDYTVDHVLERKTHPELAWDRSNWRPAHGRRHRNLGCPGNFGRSSRRPRQHWTALGW